MTTETYNMTWQGIEIELVYTPRKFGGVIAHLDIRSINPPKAPLPITTTGYLSHFHPVGTVESMRGTLIDQVTAWLDEAAQSKDWQRQLEEWRQPALF